MSADEKIDGESPAEEAAEQPAPRRKPRVRKRAAAKQETAKGAAADADQQPPADADQQPPADAEQQPPADAEQQPPAAEKRRRARSRGAKAAPKGPEREPAEAAKPGAGPQRGAPAEAPKPARRSRRGRAPRRRVVRARARYVRTSARKARLVSGHLRGKSVQDARAILAFTPREVARDWSKLLESAVANAESNHELLEADLIVRDAYADEGPTIKRFRPRAMGRATGIRKRTSHLTITLTPKP
jgi:ribosomal protein L22